MTPGAIMGPLTAGQRVSTRPALQSLLGAFDCDQFLERSLGNEALVVPGGRPEYLAPITLARINEALNLKASYPHVRLVKGGKPVPPEKYTYGFHGQVLIDPESCQRQMELGATMIGLSIERLLPELAVLIQALNRECKAEARADVILTMTPVPGLEMHWDETECFNVQLAGAKRWDLFRPDRPWPLRPTDSHGGRVDVTEWPAPVGEPTLRTVAAAGDVVYVPRGWWHVVTPVTTPSLHLSISIDVPTISDVLEWHIARLRERDEFRRNVPFWVKDDVLGALARPPSESAGISDLAQVIRDYLAERDACAAPDAGFSAIGEGRQLPRLRPESWVRLRALRRLSCVARGDQVVCRANGKEYAFNVNAMVALARVTNRWAPVSEISMGANEVLVLGALSRLWGEGVLRASAEPPLTP